MALGNLYWSPGSNGPKKAGRETSEEFMFGTEPLEAWRLWSVILPDSTGDDDGNRDWRHQAIAHRLNPGNPYELLSKPMLASANGDDLWFPRDYEPAVCTAGKAHMAPHLDCECGFWALKEDAICEAALGSYNGAHAVGKVKLWGRYVEFSKGYRAQHAYPSEVWLRNGQPNEAMRAHLADMYGIPVHLGEPEFVGVERKRQEAARAEQTEAQPTNWTSILSTYMFPRTALTWPTFLWNEDTLIPTTGWPSGLAKPSEFWDALEKHAARATEGRAT